MSREIVILEHIPADCVNTKEGQSRAHRLNRYERGPGRRIFVLQYFSELSDCRRLEKRCQGQALAELFFYLRKQAHRQQRMSTQIKEVVIDSNGARLQHIRPDRGQ